MRVRTRFAPSPTGYLHVGGARTALFSWLYARKHGGEFILRIEDTDRERSTTEAVDAILEGISWLGLDYDIGPIFQTDRFPRYADVTAQLLEQDHAYHCYCSKERLDSLRAEQLARKEKPRYDGYCRNRTGPLPQGASPVVRFRNPTAGQVVVDDLIKGRIVFQNAELDDFIIARADGTPTYNFTVVVDDIDMEITHVTRGDDHVNNTPRQINVLRTLGGSIPEYAHVPMILGEDGQRLSKRHGAVSVMQFRNDGYLPEALLNYLVRLGWSHGDQELFSTDEMVQLFDLADVNRAASIFSSEKLDWLNQHYIKNREPAQIAVCLGWQLERLGVDTSEGPDLVDVVMVQRERAKTLSQMAADSTFYYQEFDDYEGKAAAKHLKPGILAPLTDLGNQLAQLTSWTAGLIHDAVVEVAERNGLKMGKLAQPLRVAVSGRSFSPPIDVTLELVGRERSIDRINRALRYIEGQGEGA